MPMTLEESLKSLNPQQLEAVNYDAGPCLIVAGAGTGKTKTLTTKIAKLIADGYHPARILAVTFTNKAAQEMRERVDSLVPGAGKKVWIHTFHSFGVRILRQNAQALGLSRDFAIYDDSDQKKVVSLILEQMGIKDPKKEISQIVSLISRAKDDMVSPETMMQSATASGLDFKIRAAEVYRRYEQKLKEAGALDFGDLLVKTVVLLRDHEDIRSYYQEFFEYILVDEYQDTNHTQYLITKMLAAKRRKLCVVGDPDQSIYSWRGANIRNILEFEKDFQDVKTITLEQNYRSTKVILEASNRLITKNKKRKEKNLFTDKSQGDPIEVRELLTEGDEARWVSQNIKALVDEGASLKEVAVFYRTNAQSRSFEDSFRRYQIPYRLVGTVRFYDRKEIKDIMCYARILINPADNVSLLRIINTPARGLGKVAQDRFMAYAEENHLSLYDALKNAAYVPGVSAMALKAALRLVQLFENWRGDMLLTDPADIFHKILVESGYMDAVKAEMEKDPEAESRLQNLDALINAVKEYEERCHKGEKEPSVSDFLQEISLLSGEDDSNAGEGGAVTLMTVHLAKGLEFNNVFVTGLEENLFPIGKDNEDELEEERRLCYVAMTRAREKLFLTYAQSRRKFGQRQDNLPSRFLFESGLLDESEVRESTQPRYTDYHSKYGLYGAGAGGSYSGGNYGGGYSRGRNNFGGNNRYQNFEGYASKSRFQKRYDEDGYEIEDNDLDYESSSYNSTPGLGSLYSRPMPAPAAEPRQFPKGRAYPFPTASQQPVAKPAEPAPKNADGVAVGGLVKHGVFGQGKIVQVAGSGESAKITVLFGNGVRRTFMLKFAPLELL
ncbi:ATP-dependent helicase [Candidatus Avelusimicrobium fimicolum]|uniref:ATP-dependent helicase n=1 Tax=Candidatus Avelusimicrobium fimicolum TaxID=3416216 RepID=UPI003D0D08EA